MGSEEVRICEHCGERPATRTWAQDGTALAHGWTQQWCHPCVLKEQIKHAEEVSRRLPQLEDELMAALNSEVSQ